MARKRGTGSMGPTRSTRLPRALDEWFLQRLAHRPEASPSELLVALLHGGLRLREGYMSIHRRVLEHYLATDQIDYYRLYNRCLLDTFGPAYVEHLERWLEADRVSAAATTVKPATSPPSNATPARQTSANGSVVVPNLHGEARAELCDRERPA